MEKLILIILLITLIFLFLYLLLLRSAIKNIYLQLKKINESETNANLLLSCSNKYLRKLALEINKCIDKKNSTEITYKRMDRDLKDSIANISHDLRTPLTSIMGYLYLLDSHETTDIEKLEYLNTIKSRTVALKALISDFYDISRLDSNNYKLELSPINLSDVLSEILASYYNEFINRGIEPSVDVADDIPSVLADSNSVSRVFSNLIQNILRYGKTNISVSLKHEGSFVITSFKNDAPNLDESSFKKIFDRFFTVDSSRSDGSTGLGLAITKMLVEGMGHTIYSELKDSTLCISIKWRI